MISLIKEPHMHELESHLVGDNNSTTEDSTEKAYFSNYVASHTRDTAPIEVKTMHMQKKSKEISKKSSKYHSDPITIDATDIHIGNLVKHMKKKDLPGFCCEIGAPRSVIGQKELHRAMNRLQRHSSMPWKTTLLRRRAHRGSPVSLCLQDHMR